MDVRVDEAGEEGAPSAVDDLRLRWHVDVCVADLRDDAVPHDDAPMVSDALPVEQADVAHGDGGLRTRGGGREGDENDRRRTDDQAHKSLRSLRKRSQV